MSMKNTQTTRFVTLTQSQQFDVNTLEGCLDFLSNVLPAKVQDRISAEVATDPIFATLSCTYQEFYGSMMETDPKQATQSISKRLYYHWMSALILTVKEYGLEGVISLSNEDGGAGKDFLHIPTQTPVEWKTCGGSSMTSLATGSINSLAKVDDTFVVGYTLCGNTITEVKCVWVRNSYEKWVGYNKMVKGSGFSTLKCKPSDVGDITVFRGSFKLNREWIRFNSEMLVNEEEAELAQIEDRPSKLLAAV